MQNQKFSELIDQELKNKVRTVKDLARFIQKRGNYPSYSILLGAGASVTSNIASGGQLVSNWRKEIYDDIYDGLPEKKAQTDSDIINYLSKHQSIWYNPQNEYSSLFERKFDLPSQRRRFVESLVDNKKPSIGYYYLINLINSGMFNTIFTTNFDDLLNEAFYHFSDTRPHVCAHDSSIGSLSVLSSRPKVIKLHGDYLFDDIKNTLRETESLEHNTKEKFIEFSKDYGLIIVGYSGQDRSIMDVLNYLLQQEEYLKNGIYWCFREDDEIPHEVRKILWKDKVYCVKIDGFDQLFAELNSNLNIPLKQFIEKNTLKIDQCINSFLQDDFSLNNNEYIRKDLIKFREKSNNQNISDLIAKINENNKNMDLSSLDFKKILEIESFKSANNFDKALSLIDKYLNQLDISLLSHELNSFQENLILNKIDCLSKLGKTNESITIVESLINYDKYNFKYQVKKISLLNDDSEKINYLLSIYENFPNSIVIKNDLCRMYIKNFNNKKSEPKSLKITQCIEIINKSIDSNNGLDNAAYFIKIQLLNIQRDICNRLKKQAAERKKNDDEYHIEVKNLIKSMLEKNPKHSQVIDSIIEYLSKIDDFEIFNEYLNKIIKQIENCSIKQKNYILKNISQMLGSRNILEKSCADKKILQISIDFFNNSDFESNIHFLMQKIYFTISKKISIFSIEDIFNICIKHNMLSEIASPLISTFGILNLKEKTDQIYNIMKENQENLSPFESSILHKNAELYLNGSKSKTFIDYVENSRNLAPNLKEYATKYTYDLLLAEKYNDIIQFVKNNKSLIESLSDENKAILKINEYTAYKNLNNKLDKDQVEILNTIISRSYSTEISICAKSLKDDPQAYTTLKQLIDMDYHFYYFCKEWPAISNVLKAQLDKHYHQEIKFAQVG